MRASRHSQSLQFAVATSVTLRIVLFPLRPREIKLGGWSQCLAQAAPACSSRASVPELKMCFRASSPQSLASINRSLSSNSLKVFSGGLLSKPHMPGIEPTKTSRRIGEAMAVHGVPQRLFLLDRALLVSSRMFGRDTTASALVRCSSEWTAWRVDEALHSEQLSVTATSWHHIYI